MAPFLHSPDETLAPPSTRLFPPACLASGDALSPAGSTPGRTKADRTGRRTRTPHPPVPRARSGSGRGRTFLVPSSSRNHRGRHLSPDPRRLSNVARRRGKRNLLSMLCCQWFPARHLSGHLPTTLSRPTNTARLLWTMLPPCPSAQEGLMRHAICCQLVPTYNTNKGEQT